MDSGAMDVVSADSCGNALDRKGIHLSRQFRVLGWFMSVAIVTTFEESVPPTVIVR